MGLGMNPGLGFWLCSVFTRFRSASGGENCGFCCENWNSICICEMVSATSKKLMTAVGTPLAVTIDSGKDGAACWACFC